PGRSRESRRRNAKRRLIHPLLEVSLPGGLLTAGEGFAGGGRPLPRSGSGIQYDRAPMTQGATRYTRGQGLLEPFLARQRARQANRLIPEHLRAGRIL